MSVMPATTARVPRQVTLFSPILKVLLAAGVPLGFNGLITIRGRKSGLPRTTPDGLADAGAALPVDDWL